MRLVRDNLSVFEFIRTNPLNAAIFIDIDGTISEIASSPEAAFVSMKMKTILDELANRYLVTVISGRTIFDARLMIGSDKIFYIGSHGMETLYGDSIVRADNDVKIEAIAQIKRDLAPIAASLKGVRIEDKGASFAVHYRAADDVEGAGRQLMEAIRLPVESSDVEVIEGRKVIEIKPSGANKGQAMAAAIERSERGNLLYIGDDTTDVAAFNRLKELREAGKVKGFAFGVIGDETPAAVKIGADYFFTSVGDVGSFLEWLTKISA